MILQDLNLEISDGEFVIITGPSGCGKSSLLQILGLIEPATSGQYIIDHEDIKDLSPNRIAVLRHALFGFIFQRYHLIEHLTILDNILLPLQYGEHHDGPERAQEYMQSLGIDHLKNRHPSQLSYGQQQRASIARAMITQPKIILADEPTGSLDPENSILVMEELRKIHNQGQTVILITHNLELIQKTDIHYKIENKQMVRVS